HVLGEDSWAVLDHGRGRWPYRISWNWGAGSGRSHGRVVGLQVGGGRGPTGPARRRTPSASTGACRTAPRTCPGSRTAPAGCGHRPVLRPLVGQVHAARRRDNLVRRAGRLGRGGPQPLVIRSPHEVIRCHRWLVLPATVTQIIR